VGVGANARAATSVESKTASSPMESMKHVKKDMAAAGAEYHDHTLTNHWEAMRSRIDSVNIETERRTFLEAG
jgi:hypothetical protein